MVFWIFPNLGESTHGFCSITATVEGTRGVSREDAAASFDSCPTKNLKSTACEWQQLFY